MSNDFQEILLNKNRLAKEFAKLSPIHGQKVLDNLEACKAEIPLISNELLEMLKKEGLSINDLSVTKVKKEENIEDFSFFVDNGIVIAKKPKRGRVKSGLKGEVIAYADLTEQQKKQASDLF